MKTQATFRMILAGILGCLLFAQQAVAQAPAGRAAQAAPAADTRNDYRLGAGDVIRITVFQSPELSLETRVAESGVISYPLLGTVQVGGLTVTAAEKRIADGLRSGNFVRQPQVSIMLMQVRSSQASVLGQVGRPGRYPLESTSTKLSELVAMAGGIGPGGADIATVVGQRNGAPYRVQVDLPAIFTGIVKADDVLIQNGDVVYVDRGPMVYMYGEVQRPGAMRLERNMTVLQALAAAGGLTQRGTEKGLRVHRRGPDGRIQVVQPAMEDQLRDGDVVYLRESLF